MSRSIQMFAPIGRAWFNVMEGGVMNHETHRWAETHVSSSGGGGYVHPEYGGAVVAPTVTSTVVNRENTQFWIEDKDGKQNSFTLSNAQLPVADGHIVKIVWGGKVGNENGTILYARNYASGRELRFTTQQLWSWARGAGLANYPLIYRMVFYWLPFLFVAYLVVIWAPLTTIMRYEKVMPSMHDVTLSDLVDSFTMHFQYLKWWKWEIAAKDISRLDIGSWFFVGCIAMGFHFISKAIGYLLLGQWMRPIIIYPLKMAVRELAESPES